jgi:hypothetical protein
MKIKSLALAVALACTLAPAFAADQTVDFAVTPSFIGTAPILAGGDDVITFTNIAAGTYDVVLSLSAQYITGLTATLNGVSASIYSPNSTVTFADVEATLQSPFTLVLTGTASSKSLYSGELSITPVPEPETYALMLAGLGVLGFVSRRRRS